MTRTVSSPARCRRLLPIRPVDGEATIIAIPGGRAQDDLVERAAYVDDEFGDHAVQTAGERRAEPRLDVLELRRAPGPAVLSGTLTSPSSLMSRETVPCVTS